ncbi:DUF421 domain-containing protein [Caldimonas brevitalea]|uniref:Membrane protein n=1 Tax=Caldimonas brevitalea TaxID=413882 RepID=A0A0G3BRK5_9BURK|nr:YetF domain-containing protein [Caldimonas brevitalea]AKJ30613.1 membrane protein [Caldimonas brevitalea]
MMSELFAFHVSAAELMLRGTLMYWFLFLIFRFVVRRDVGAVGVADVLVLVVIADASQNAMSGGYNTVSEGCVLVSTIIGWNVLLDWASFRYPRVRRFAQAPPLPLILHGRVLHRNLRREYLSIDELKSKLREEGIEHIAEVKAAYMEADGGFSVIRSKGAASTSPPPHNATAP